MTGTERDFGELYADSCEHGLSVARPLLPAARDFDKEGWNYGNAKPASYQAYGRLRALLALSEAQLLRPSRVLEVAAGDAALCACLQEMGCEVVANDLRAENLQQSTSQFRNGDKIGIMTGDLFSLDANVTGRFDLVIACEIIEHVAHAVDFLSQLARFLNPAGHILLTTPNGAYFRNKLPTYSQIENFDALESRQFKPDADGHLYLITPPEMEAIAAKASLNLKRLAIWATPFISGEAGFRLLGRLLPVRPCYQLESLSHKLLPGPMLRRFGNSMSVVLARTA